VSTWRVTGASAVTLGVLLVIGGSAMPWLRTGQRRRSSYELFGIVDRLGFAPGGFVGLAIRMWPLVPLLAVTAAVCAWFAPRWSLLPALVAALYAGGVGFAVANVDAVQVVGVESGPSITTAGALLVVLGAAVATWSARCGAVPSTVAPVSPGATGPDR